MIFYDIYRFLFLVYFKAMNRKKNRMINKIDRDHNLISNLNFSKNENNSMSLKILIQIFKLKIIVGKNK